MISRLVIVGLVAVLGVLVPSQSESDSWFGSVRVWMISQLAEWNAGYSKSRPDTDLGVVMNPLDFLGPDQVRLAAVTLEADLVEPDLKGGIADELNRFAEGYAITRVPDRITGSRLLFEADPSIDSVEMKLAVAFCHFVEGWEADRSQVSNAPSQPEVVESKDAFEADLGVFAPVTAELASTNIPVAPLPSQPVDNFGGMFEADLGVFAPVTAELASTNIPVAPLPSQPVDNFGGMFEADLGVFAPAAERLAWNIPAVSLPTEAVDAFDGMFEADLGVFAPAEPKEISNIPAPSMPVASRMEFALIEPCAVGSIGIADDLNRLGERVEFRPVHIRVRNQTLETIAAPGDLGAGIAYELNRASEGSRVLPFQSRKVVDDRRPSPSKDHVAHSERKMNDDSRVGEAVRLTREAAFAWVSVLTRPTSVEMTSR